MLTSGAAPCGRRKYFLEGQVAFSHTRLSNNRSVMPLDVRGCTRATLSGSSGAYPALTDAGNPLNPTRDRDWGLQLFPMNEEFPVSAVHKLALIKSLPFVHTARRYYRLDGLVRSSDGPRRRRRRRRGSAQKTIKLDYLEEVKVVTRAARDGAGARPDDGRPSPTSHRMFVENPVLNHLQTT
uniref:Uncharacterized protein n=2 Tax=Gasterosteus aculeatus aculeatus TaxID=481459 RepID=G3N917_GASAC